MAMQNNIQCADSCQMSQPTGFSLSAIRDWAKRWMETHYGKLAARSALTKFAEMSDRELDDIGLTRLDLVDARVVDDQREAISLLRGRRDDRITRRR